MSAEGRATEAGSPPDPANGPRRRRYVIAPYRLVKDLRTGIETGKVDDVLDGDLAPFIEAFLLRVRRTDRVVDE